MHALKRFGTAFGGYKMMENYPRELFQTTAHMFAAYVRLVSRATSSVANIK